MDHMGDGWFLPSFWVLFRDSRYFTGHQLDLGGLEADGTFLPTSCAGLVAFRLSRWARGFFFLVFWVLCDSFGNSESHAEAVLADLS